jgi:Cu/Ag efflux protein CusF
MKSKFIVAVTCAAALSFAWGASPTANNASNPGPRLSTAAVTPVPTPTTGTPKDGDYPGKGVVTKINLQNQGSVELDHDEIKGVMAPMRMEFNVSDKKMLDGITIGEKVDCTLRYKDHNETIVNITKAK